MNKGSTQWGARGRVYDRYESRGEEGAAEA